MNFTGKVVVVTGFIVSNQNRGMLFLTDDNFASAVTGVILPIDCGFAAYSGV